MRIKEIPKDAVPIKDSYDFIDRNGKVYSYNKRNNQESYAIMKEQCTIHGYKYCGIRMKSGGVKSRRVHRLVAEAFLENKENYPIVMHLNNNKADNRVENLKWGTISENTKQAFLDGLEKNASGFDDSQSYPCDCYDTLTNKLIKKFGSVSEASRETGISKGTILKQLSEKYEKIKKMKYFVHAGEKPIEHEIVVMYDFKTDREIRRFPNSGLASVETKIPQSRILDLLRKNKKAKYKNNNFYFLRVKIK